MNALYAELQKSMGVDFQARELWRTCVHEYGHVMVSCALGFPACAEIAPNESGNLKETAWRGRTFFFPAADAADNSVICMAGVVEEILLIDFPDEGITFADAEREAAIVRRIYPTGRFSRRTAMTEWCGMVGQEISNRLDDGISETDLAGMGEGWWKQVRKTVRLVMKHSDEILREARFAERSWLGETR
jgi:hypothetical protein